MKFIMGAFFSFKFLHLLCNKILFFISLTRGGNMFIKNNSNILIFFLTFIFLSSICFAQKNENNQSIQIQKKNIIQLPTPYHDGKVSLEKALNKRRSIREYSEDSLSISEISQILFAAQGITKKNEDPPSSWRGKQWKWMGGHRTAPSAGALYPIELYIAIGKVKGLSQGLYKYNPQEHTIIRVLEGDKRVDISNAALKQSCIRKGAVDIIIFGVYKRTAVKYGKRAEQYVQIECGAVCQNIYLQSYALDLGTVFVGAFKDDSLKFTLNIPEDEYPLGIMPIGKIIQAK
jgi:SagB-type dehydrogenase family enzyme